mmetsp:Transcript_5387/g.20105  ORF Transcript_5387/g.20105 Transcript_5387/m.20105 type:complete len:362 (-) Transcript_5387:1498-2583(-)|eukprot:CAMPEP_0117435520 /NCGR_PEP_ID=MMETSP0759-20121206/525_1 /TAXON_ID=63605 /ORGANISM="Percolomonas cosmopolitus, Strain WS" /LENGTH=361 /DNA_ID=CAMNT_0005227073 /DNA_START=283 /DNA_END=1368 /DNA_ORIENTATION=+
MKLPRTLPLALILVLCLIWGIFNSSVVDDDLYVVHTRDELPDNYHERAIAAEKWRNDEISKVYDNVLTNNRVEENKHLQSGEIFEKYANLFVNPKQIKFRQSENVEDKVSEMWIWRNRAHRSFDKALNKWKLKFSAHSLGLEGNHLTEYETEAIIDKDIIPGKKQISMSDLKQLLDHAEAVNALVDMIHTSFSSPITEEDVLQLHTVLMHNAKLAKGEYRNHNVALDLQKLLFPQHQEVPALMKKFFEYMNSEAFREADTVLQACLVHHHFSRLRPFASGNGRMSRMMMNFVLLKNRFPFVIIPKEKKDEYWEAIIQTDHLIKNKEFHKEAKLCTLIGRYAEKSIDEFVDLLRKDFLKVEL